MEKETETAYEYLRENVGAAGASLRAKLLKFAIKALPFEGFLFTKETVDQLSSVEWWDSLQKLKSVLSLEVETIDRQHLLL